MDATDQETFALLYCEADMPMSDMDCWRLQAQEPLNDIQQLPSEEPTLTEAGVLYLL